MHLVLGTGPVGLAVVRALRAGGARVRVVNRSGQADVPQGAVVVSADLSELDEARRVCRKAEVIYQCAQPGSAHWPDRFPQLQSNVLEAAAGAGARVVIAEDCSLYGAGAPMPLTEDLPHAATSRRGVVRAQLADAALAAHRDGNVRVTIGRASDLFGPGVLYSAMGARAFLAALDGKGAALMGRLDLPHTYTFVEDMGRALVTLGEHDEALGKAWHVPNAEAVTQGEFMAMAFEAMGVKPRMKGSGALALRLVGLFVREARESAERMYAFEKPFVVDSSKFERALGATATPLREAIRQTVEWFRERFGAPAT